jgi:LPXTG-motif cell wall-anchored protein
VAGGTQRTVEQAGAAVEAGTSTSRESATRDASEATDVEQLAHTGGAAGLALLGAGLVAAGAGLAAVGRKREDEDEEADATDEEGPST